MSHVANLIYINSGCVKQNVLTKLTTKSEPNRLCKNQSWKWLTNLTGKNKKGFCHPLMV